MFRDLGWDMRRVLRKIWPLQTLHAILIYKIVAGKILFIEK